MAGKRFFLVSLCFLLLGPSSEAQVQDSSSLAVIQRIDACMQSGNVDRACIDALNNLVDSAWISIYEVDTLSARLHKITVFAEHSGYEAGYAKALLHYGRFLVRRHENIHALRCLYKAEKIFAVSNDLENQAYTSLQIGLAYYGQKIYSTAEKHFFRSTELYRKTGDQSKLGTSLYLAGLCNSELKKFFLAKSSFLTARKIKSSLNDERGVAECNTGLGQLFINMNLPDSALVYLEASLGYLLKSKKENARAKFYLMKASALVEKNRYDEAFDLVQTGFALAEKHSVTNLRLDAYKLFSEIEDKRNHIAEAYNFQKKYLALHDSLYNEEDTRTVAQMESAFLMEEQQKEIQQLEKEAKLRKTLFIAFLVIATLSLIIAFILFRLYRFKQKTNEKLNVTLAELRAAQEQLIRHEKLAALGKLASNLAHEIQNPLNFVNNFSDLATELCKELAHAKTEAEKKEIIITLTENLSKINDHGKRADAIIKKVQKQLLEGTGYKLFED